jgi:hypothetical protein
VLLVLVLLVLVRLFLLPLCRWSIDLRCTAATFRIHCPFPFYVLVEDAVYLLLLLY